MSFKHSVEPQSALWLSRVHKYLVKASAHGNRLHCKEQIHSCGTQDSSNSGLIHQPSGQHLGQINTAAVGAQLVLEIPHVLLGITTWIWGFLPADGLCCYAPVTTKERTEPSGSSSVWLLASSFTIQPMETSPSQKVPKQSGFSLRCSVSQLEARKDPKASCCRTHPGDPKKASCWLILRARLKMAKDEATSSSLNSTFDGCTVYITAIYIKDMMICAYMAPIA